MIAASLTSAGQHGGRETRPWCENRSRKGTNLQLQSRPSRWHSSSRVTGMDFVIRWAEPRRFKINLSDRLFLCPKRVARPPTPSSRLARMLVMLLTMCLTIATATESEWQRVTGTLGSEVVLPCQGEARRGRVYWQKGSLQSGKEKVVNGLCLRSERCSEFVDPAYAGRSDFLANGTGGDFSLRLRGLTLADEGLYKCILLNSPVTSQRNVSLSVKAVGTHLKPLGQVDPFLGLPGGQPGFSQLSPTVVAISVLAWIGL